MNITYGRHTYGKINPIVGTGKITVGKYCSIAKGVEAFFAGDHNTNIISTYPFYHQFKITSPSLPTTKEQSVNTGLEIIIGNDVWIGYRATLFKGVTIGDGAIIGAFSVITKDIPPYSIAVGHSRIVRKRFSQEDIDFLLELKWWDFPDQEVIEIAPILHNTEIKYLRDWAKEHNKI